jgi:hypothetical protein
MAVNGVNSSAIPLSSNAIINGAFDIWQRGTSFSGGGGYTADRWNNYAVQSSKFTSARSTDIPTNAGVIYSWLGTSTSAYTPISGDYFMNTQRIEGFDAAQFNFGTALAKSLTLSFWVKSSLTGTFGGACHNNAFDRTFVFSYTISAANTWEYKTVTIPGDTGGTWEKTTAVGFELGFSLGAHSGGLTTAGSWVSGAFWGVTGQVNLVETSGATWQVTGVQLEAGLVGTPFKRNANSFQGELAACQRYYWRVNKGSALFAYIGAGFVVSSTQAKIVIPHPVEMRAAPAFSVVNPLNLQVNTANTRSTTTLAIDQATPQVTGIFANTGSGMTTGDGAILMGANNLNWQLEFSAEL